MPTNAEDPKNNPSSEDVEETLEDIGRDIENAPDGHDPDTSNSTQG